MSTPAFRILYVEDNELLRETVGMLMEADGRELVLVDSAEAALAALAASGFDLVVTDVSLPGLSGIELAQRLLAEAPGRPIVLCSGRDLGDVPRALGPNVRALPKPFEFDALDALIAEAAALPRGTA